MIKYLRRLFCKHAYTFETEYGWDLTRVNCPKCGKVKTLDIRHIKK